MRKLPRRLSLSRETLVLLEDAHLAKGGTTGSEGCCMTTMACFYMSDCGCSWVGC